MSVAGLKKQFHKATQKVSEKVGGAEGTKLDDDFLQMEKKVDTTGRAVLDIMTKTTEYLQPNPVLFQHHLKKMQGRRLDFDYKKKRHGKGVLEEEITQALEKFDESKEVAEQSMFNLLESDIEQVSQLAALVQAQLEYHRQATEILQQLSSKLHERIREAQEKPRKEYVPKPRMVLELLPPSDSHNGGLNTTKSPGPARTPAPMDQPCCRALYDFVPENEGELGFKDGEIITLTNQIDDNWYEGMVNGQSGFFPINYVDILVPLPH
ncbi:endophilin-A1-like [Salvelinus fontinalis]|uniref:endophilin-A1-like n=1 Tax=Salvelinus fontinalis TaxID=8038 RepID=UPI0024863E91|nr:endophilin-A1-like [Salvelinus fontinalis]